MAVNRELAAKERALAGIRGYITNLQACPNGTPVTVEIQVGDHTITAADPLPADLSEAFDHIHRDAGMH